LRHPNIVRAYEMRYAERGPIRPDTPYLVLEHVRGRPAHRALEPGRIDDATVESLATQVLSALVHVHAAGCVHRDLKPGNVLARRLPGHRLRFKLTDFGLATKTGASSPTGRFSGSLPYVAPEALLGLPLDGRTDLYGLGILLYHLTTGELPVPNGGAAEFLQWHLSGPAADPSRVRRGVSPRLARFVRRLTRRDRDERPASASRALRMLDVHAPVGQDRACIPVTAKGALACLRLALDAVRLGARRVFRVPPSPTVADALLRELSVWTQVRGLRFYRLTNDPARLVLQLLADRGADGEALVRRFGLNRWLALDVVGGVPLPDPARLETRGTPAGRAAVRLAARAIGDFVADCAGRRPLVLCGVRASDGPPLVRELLRRLARDAAAGDGPAPTGRGGLLLVVDP
jgi:hypothetical protein